MQGIITIHEFPPVFFVLGYVFEHFYRPQTKFAKVMFLQVSVCPQGGHAWLLWGACMVALGGVHGCSGGHAWLLLGGHAWLLWGECVVAWGVCVVLLGRGMHGFSDEIRSISGRYASYWNAFLFIK